jgi:hypothetical protein
MESKGTHTATGDAKDAIDKSVSGNAARCMRSRWASPSAVRGSFLEIWGEKKTHIDETDGGEMSKHSPAGPEAVTELPHRTTYVVQLTT